MKLKFFATIIFSAVLPVCIFAQKVTEIVSDEPLLLLGTGANEKYPYLFHSENGGKLFISKSVQTGKIGSSWLETFFSELDLATNRLRNVSRINKYPSMPLAVTENFIYYAEYPATDSFLSLVKRINRKTNAVETITQPNGNALGFADKNIVSSRFYAYKDKVVVVSGINPNGSYGLKNQYLAVIEDSKTVSVSIAATQNAYKTDEKGAVLTISPIPQSNDLVINQNGIFLFAANPGEEVSLFYIPASLDKKNAQKVFFKDNELITKTAAVGEKFYLLVQPKGKPYADPSDFELHECDFNKFVTEKRATISLTRSPFMLTQNQITMHAKGNMLYIVGGRQIVMYDTVAKTTKTLVPRAENQWIGILNNTDRIAITDGGTVYYRQLQTDDKGGRVAAAIMAYDPQTNNSNVLYSKAGVKGALLGEAEETNAADLAYQIGEYLLTGNFDKSSNAQTKIYDKSGLTKMIVNFPKKYKDMELTFCYPFDTFGDAAFTACHYEKKNPPGHYINYKVTF